MTKRNANAWTGTRSMVDLVEDAVALVRLSGWRALVPYCLGTVPFAALFVAFFADMSIMAYDPVRLVGGALLLAIFFVWMKCWQAVYAARLWERLQGPDADTPRHWLRMAARQAALHPLALLLLPLSLLALVPYGAVYAYCQNLTVLDQAGEMKARELSREARRHAMEAPRQSFLLIWAISPSVMIFVAALAYLITPLTARVMPEGLMAVASLLYGIVLVLFFPLSPLPVILGLNVLAALTIGPMLLHTLFGVSSTLLENGGIWDDSLSLVSVAAVVYLLLDPVVKAAYALRCFRSGAAHTGADLRIALRGTRAPIRVLLAVCGLAVLLSGGVAGAQEAAAQEASAPAAQAAPAGTIAADQLNGRLDEVFKSRSYAWRIPGEKDLPATGALRAFVDGISRSILDWSDWLSEQYRRFREWLDDLFGGDSARSARSSGGALNVDALLVLLLVLLLCAAIFLFWNQRRSRTEGAPLAAIPVEEPKPDVADENTLATDLPDDEWARMAAHLAAQGDLRGAMRAAFLSLLAWLAAQDFVRVARAKSNREYGGELERRAHARPDCLAAFRTGVSVYEPVWYGNHPVTAEQVSEIINLGERLRRGELVR